MQIVMTALLAAGGLLGDTSAEPVTILVLPVPQHRPEVQLLADRLAERLQTVPSLRVVDRTQIDRILREKEHEAEGPFVRPAMAYDLMLRLSVALPGERPTVRCELVRLSNGNVAASREAVLPEEKDWGPFLDDLVALCQRAAKGVSAPEGRRATKLRLLGVTILQPSARLEPLREQLEQAISYTAGKCPGVTLVHHLDAMTVKEESLLLALGLSQLPGGRQFVPQADVVVEAELREVNAEGRTFPETPLEVHLRFGPADEWESVAGTVVGLKDLASAVCLRVSSRLGASRPAGLDDFLTDMSVRRAQAEAEFKAAMARADRDGKPPLGLVAAAVKIDPTYEPAVFWMIESLCFHKDVPAEQRRETIVEALRYLRRFPASAKNRKRVVQLASYAARGELAAQYAEAARQIVELNLASSLDRYGTDGSVLIKPVCASMRAAGVSYAERRRWLDELVVMADAMRERIGAREPLNAIHSLVMVRLRAIEEALGAGDVDRARQLLRELMESSGDVGRSWSWMPEELRKLAARTGDPELVSEFDRRIKPLTRVVDHLHVRWPDPLVYADSPVTLADKAVQTFRPATPLLIGDGRLFVATGGTITHQSMTGWVNSGATDHHLGYLTLGDHGGPAERSEVTVLPVPSGWERVSITSAALLAGRVFVGTKAAGLRACTLADGSWKRYRAEEGLPELAVFSVHPVGPKTLLCVGGKLMSRGAYLTLDLESDQFTLLHRFGSKKLSIAFWSLDSVWRDGDKLMGTNYLGLAVDVLGERPTFQRRWPDSWFHGWRPRANTVTAQPISVATVGDRRWVLATNGLHEIDAAGKVLRTWANRQHFSHPGRSPYDFSITWFDTASDFPNDSARVEYHGLCATKEHLFLIGSEGRVLCYDPARDAWYGPLQLPGIGGGHELGLCVGGERGVWIGTDEHLIYVDAAAFIEASKAASRAMTSEQVARRKLDAAAEAGPLELVKYHILLHDLEAARDLVLKYVASNPRDPQGLLLAARVFEFHCLNQPQEAIKYYRALSALKDAPEAVHEGLLGVFRVNYALKEWSQAVEAGEQLLAAFPRLTSNMDGELGRTLAAARREMQKQTSSRPDGSAGAK